MFFKVRVTVSEGFMAEGRVKEPKRLHNGFFVCGGGKAAANTWDGETSFWRMNSARAVAHTEDHGGRSRHERWSHAHGGLT